jgi:hypothetical protein
VVYFKVLRQHFTGEFEIMYDETSVKIRVVDIPFKVKK